MAATTADCLKTASGSSRTGRQPGAERDKVGTGSSSLPQGTTPQYLSKKSRAGQKQQPR